MSRRRSWSAHIIAKASHQACCFSVGNPQARPPDHLLLWVTKPQGLPSLCMLCRWSCTAGHCWLWVPVTLLFLSLMRSPPPSLLMPSPAGKHQWYLLHMQRQTCCIASCTRATEQLVRHLMPAKQSNSGGVLQCCTLSVELMRSAAPYPAVLLIHSAG